MVLNLAHVHLLLNHVPTVGFAVGLGLCLLGILRKSDHLKQASPDDPFHNLLLARAYEKLGQKAEARQTYQKVLDSQQAGIERALAYPEAKRKVHVL